MSLGFHPNQGDKKSDLSSPRDDIEEIEDSEGVEIAGLKRARKRRENVESEGSPGEENVPFSDAKSMSVKIKRGSLNSDSEHERGHPEDKTLSMTINNDVSM